jgi:MFS family permease
MGKAISGRKKAAVFLLLLFIIVFFASLAVYNTFYLISFRTIDMQVRVSGDIGFSSAADELDFGSAPPGSTIVRSIEIENSRPHKVRASISISGNISQMTSLTAADQVIGPMESKKINFTVRIPVQSNQGNYSGSARIFIKRG